MKSFIKKNLFFFMLTVAFMISKSQADGSIYGGLTPINGDGPRIKGCYDKTACDAKGQGNVLIGTENCYNSKKGTNNGCGTLVGCAVVTNPNSCASGGQVSDCVNDCQGGQSNGKCCISRVWDD